MESAYGYKLFHGNGNENNELGIGFFVLKRIISAVKVKFISDRMSQVRNGDKRTAARN
jgi:hypothetical protein